MSIKEPIAGMGKVEIGDFGANLDLVPSSCRDDRPSIFDGHEMIVHISVGNGFEHAPGPAIETATVHERLQMNRAREDAFTDLIEKGLIWCSVMTELTIAAMLGYMLVAGIVS